MSLLDICRSQDDSILLARSAEGRLYTRREGDWELYDFNEIYKGYYPSCTFTALTNAGGMFHLAGTDRQGNAHLYVSLLGGVWEERDLAALQPMAETVRLKGEVLRILYDDESNQVFLVCRNGQLATLPDCPKCVKIVQLRGTTATDAWLEGDSIFIRYADGSTQRVPKREAVQYRVSLSHTYRCLEQGAVLIDLRTPDEYAAMHLRGSINVPFDLLADRLSEFDPQKTIIFVCRIGIKADEAVLYARRRGFSKVFSLGGVDSLSHV